MKKKYERIRYFLERNTGKLLKCYGGYLLVFFIIFLVGFITGIMTASSYSDDLSCENLINKYLIDDFVVKDNEKIYQNFRSTVDASLDKYFIAFREQINNIAFWQPPIFYEALCAFTRYYVAGQSEKSSQFFNNIEGFLSDIVQSERYSKLVETMEDLADELKYKQEEEEQEYNKKDNKAFITVKETRTIINGYI